MSKISKKVLLGTSALIGTVLLAATTAQAHLKGPHKHPAPMHGSTVTVGGYVQFEAGWFDDNFDNRTDREFQMEAEVHVKVKKVADNGMEYGAAVQLKGSTDDSVAADEVKLWVENKWGHLEVGDIDGAADVMAYYAPKVGMGQAVDADYDDWLDGASKPQIGPKALDSADSTKISIYSPRVSGFQVGASFAPEFDEGENIVRSSRDELTTDDLNGNTAAVNNALIDYVQPNTTSARNSTLDNTARGDAEKFFKRSFEDFIELGANWVGKMHDVDIALAGGYVRADHKTVADGANARHDFQAWHFGGQLKYQGWGFGGSYVDNEKSGQLKSKTRQDRQAWNVGGSYENGPWGFGLNYLSEDLGGVKEHGQGTYRAWGVGTSYKLAPGMAVNLDFVSFQRKFGADPANVNLKIVPSGLKSTQSKDSGHVIVFGSRFEF